MSRILFIGAHPDDPDILFGGTALKLVKAGNVVKFVSATNGDTGHMTMSRKETAETRKKEALASSKLIGLYDYEILEHDCGLEPSVENRREMVRVIRKFAPDLVISHRLCDYHPDHRATAQLVQDCTYVCMVPHFCEDTPIPDKCPVFAYSYDRFLEPRPHRPDAIVEIDSVIDEKLALQACHYSQYFEWLPWAEGQKDFDASRLNAEERKQHLMKWNMRFSIPEDDERRKQLLKVYGSKKGQSIRLAESFEQSSYGRMVTSDEFQALFGI